MESKKRILIADADVVFRDALIEALSEEGDMEVVGTTDDGERAVELVRSCKPDILVMDLILSHMDGLDVLAALDAAGRPKVMVLSALARGGTTELALARGANYCLMKPCKLSSAVERIRQITTPLHGEDEFPDRLSSRPHQSLEASVTSIIHEIGVPAHIKGYQYLREAIIMTVENMDVINPLSRSGQALQYHRIPGGARHPSRHRGGLGPRRSGDPAKVFRLYRLQRQGQAHEF